MTEYKDRTMEHIVHYWLKNMEKSFLMFIGFALIYSVYQFVLIGDKSFAECLEQTPLIMLGGGVVILGIVSISVVRMSIPFAISFGSTRKEAYLGFQVSSLLMMIQIFLSYTIASILISGTDQVFTMQFLRIALFVFGIMLVSLGIGQLFAIILSKMSPRVAVIFMMILIMAIVFAIGILAALSKINSIDLLNMSWKMGMVSAACGILIYLVGSIFNYKNVLSTVVIL